MASSTSHRATQSISSSNLQAPAPSNQARQPQQQRRMTSPAGSLSLPPRGRSPSPRPRSPSPLRNGFVPDSSTGIDPDDISEDGSDDEADDHGKWQRSPSPASSVSHLAASFVQRMGTFVGGIAPRSPLLSDAELEAEAERERDRSRREAEAILTREAQQRRLVEDRVLAMMESTKSLPPPPSRAQTLPNPPSPSNSQKESSPSWWSAAKNRLTPTKEPPTPAQQIILDAKARDKDNKKNAKGKEKEWPANAQGKFNDPAFANLNIPVTPVRRVPVPSSSPTSPTPSRPSLSNMPPNLTPSPMRTTDTLSSSPSREAPPLYTQFNAQGTLDLPGTLLMIAKRFEKLEKWTVGHVRALEERMNDVERWLVDKEKEKESESVKDQSNSSDLKEEMREIRDEVVELQGRVGELGREMAKIATAPSNLSAGPIIQSASVSVAPQTTSSIVTHATGNGASPSPVSTPMHPRLASTTARESTSPPMTSKRRESGTRLPYPTGDYASPPDTFSPSNSPPSSISSAMRTHPLSIAGLPGSSGLGSLASASYSSTSLSSLSSGLSGRPLSPLSQPKFTPAAVVNRTASPTPAPKGLPAPKSMANQRQTSISPTPRKRYTVALGGPITAPPDLSSNAAEPPRRVGTPGSFSARVVGSTFSASAVDDDDDDDEDFGDETIGKSTGTKFGKNGGTSSTNLNSGSLIPPGGPGGGDYKSTATTSSPSPSTRRIRAQSAYGYASLLPPQTPTTTTSGTTAPLKPKLRSRSTERLTGGAGDGMISGVGGPGATKFVDPLLLRRQQEVSVNRPLAMPKPIGKVPIGQLVAFFDGEKRDK